MADQNRNNNIEEEEIEENDNGQNPEEYEEENVNQNLEEEEGQEFAVAFDIQINDGSYILLIGKTEEKKLILRLVDKDDENKPFFQNEFSLDELKEINNYFLHYTNENDAIDSIIKNLNENDKEIEILDDNNIKLTVQINEEEGGTNVDFILPKLTYEIEGDEEEQINQNVENGMNIQNEGEGEEIENIEDINKEGIVENENENENENIDTENYIENVNNIEANLEYSEENNEKNGQITPQLQVQNIENNLQIEPRNNNQSINRRYNMDNNQKDDLGIIIEDNNENNLSKNQNRQSQELTKENEEKEKGKEEEKNGEETKISRVIEELKNNLDSLGGAMNYIEQDEEEQEQNTNENEINANKAKNEDFNLFKNEIVKMINEISDSFNKELKKQNDLFNSQQKSIKDENDKKMKELEDKLNIKDNELNDIKNNFNKILNEKINNLQNDTKKEINKLSDELKTIKNQENNSNKKYERITNDKRINSEIERINNNINLKIKDIEQKMNNLKNDINKNNKNNDGINIRALNDKITNFENKIKRNDEILNNNTKLINDRKNNIDNKIASLESKLSVLETSIKERKNLSEKVSSLENKTKILESKLNNLEKNKKTENDNKEIIDRLNNLDNLITELENDKNESDEYFQKAIDEINNNDIINKVNNLIQLTNKQDNDLKNLNESFSNILKTIQKSNSKNQIQLKQPKESGDLYQKISISSDEQKKPSSNIKKFRNQKKNQNEINKNNMISKNYRIIRQLDEDATPDNKKYISQTYSRTNQLTSHSVNRLNIRPNNQIENNVEYQTNTRPRSRSKEHKNKKEQEQEQQNNYEYKPIKTNYRIQNYSYSTSNLNKYDNNIDSKIIQEADIEFIENRLREIYPNYDFIYNLVYRASEDGDKASDFHRNCDKIGPNITLIKTRNGYIFGGFTVKNWEHLKRDININKPNLGSASRDPKAFGFSVNYQKIYDNIRKNEFAIWCNRNYGPTFKNNFFQILDKALEKGGYCSSRSNSHVGGQKSDYEINGGESKFAIYEIEVFELVFQ